MLAPGTARRNALDEALTEIAAGRRAPSPRWKVRFGLMLGLERVLSSKPPATAAGTELRKHQIDALAGMLTELIAANQRDAEEDENGNGHVAVTDDVEELEEEDELVEADEDDEPETFAGEDPGASRRYRFRHPTASGKTIAAAGFVESAKSLGDPDPHAPPPARLPVPARPDDRGLRRALHGRDREGARAAPPEPDHDPDLRLVRAPRRLDLARGLPARDLRRGAHRPRREDERGDPQLPRAGLHRHDRHRAADREAGLRRLPGLGRRPAARRRGPARPRRAAPLPARAAGGRDQLRADRRRRLRGARARRSPRPPGAEPGGGEPLPRPLRLDPGHRLRRRRRARVQPRAGVPRRRDQGRGRLRQDATREAGGDARRVRAGRDQRPDQRDAARRGLELAARDRLHAPGADRVEAGLPAAHRPDHAHAPAQGGRHRARLRAEVVHALRPRDLAALAARRGLLPRGRPRHAGPAPPRPAPRTPQALAGAVARPGHARRRAPARGDPARVAADRPQVPGRGRAALLGDDRRAPDPLRPARRLRQEVHRGARLEGRARDLPLDLRRREPQPAPADDGAPGPRLDDRRARRLRRPRHARDAGAAVGEGSLRRRADPAARDR